MGGFVREGERFVLGLELNLRLRDGFIRCVIRLQVCTECAREEEDDEGANGGCWCSGWLCG